MAIGLAASHSFSELRPISFERKQPSANEVSIQILFCGVCHSDLHQVKDEWKNTLYPCLPGHEIVGRVVGAGAAVSKFAVGDLVGVGCMIDSCHECSACREGLENYCERGFLATYNGNMRQPTEENHTFGGYSDSIVVREDFVLAIPDGLSPEEAAPILCAGVTTYSPLKHWGAGPGKKVGIVGYGGLGQMAAKLAKALGAEVTVITSKEQKGSDALDRGADGAILSSDSDAMSRGEGTLDLIVSTIPQPHDANLYIPLLRREGVYAVVGCIAPLSAPPDLSKMILDRKSLGTSLIGGIRETQEVLNFCAEHKITPSIEVIPIASVNDAFKQIDKGEIDFRYVIDMATLEGIAPDDSFAAKIGL